MASFQYKALDADGRFVTGELQADTAAAVGEHLRELGYTLLESAEKRDGSGGSWWRTLTAPRLPQREVTVLIRDLALLLKAGLPLDEALKLLGDGARPAVGRLVADLRRGIGSGATFAEALAAHPQSFSAEVIAMVRVAEAAGGLEQVLDSLAIDRARREQVADKINSALRYPIFLLIVAVCVLSFFLVFVVPQFAVVLKDFGTKPDPLVGTVLALSEWLNANGDLALGVLAALIGIGFLLLRMPSTRGPIIRWFRRLPGIRGIVEMRRAATICRGFGTLLGNGVTLTDALKVMTESAGADREALSDVHERVRRGGRLVDALTSARLVPPLAARMLRVGEESGELATVARRSADFYEAKLAERLDRLAAIVGPSAIVVISVVVGGLIVSIMSTLLSVNQVVL